MIRSILIAALAGAVIWAVSPVMTGQPEPWDAGGLYYCGAMVLGGLLSGLIATGPLWALYVGAILGQVLYQLVFLPLDPLILVGLLFLSAWSLLFLFGAYLGSRIRGFVSARSGATR
ncbi:hypothetical protein [Stutzerimonas azotifigens]|uniref:hypothetical protein n=1 Tax=Stutzerimonas azotifigens TaxID=291995 RepID=UPI002E815ED4|nr:hypothetical protein [Stutzerimonas azotifigens]